MSNVDNTDLNSVPASKFQEALDTPEVRIQYAAKVARWLGDVAHDQFASDRGLAIGVQYLLKEFGERIEQGRLELPEDLR